MVAEINSKQYLSFLFGSILCVIGILNLIFIHSTPALFYFMISIPFWPITDKIISNRFKIKIPFYLKLFVFLIVMWGTLGVGDLMELAEAKWL